MAVGDRAVAAVEGLAGQAVGVDACLRGHFQPACAQADGHLAGGCGGRQVPGGSGRGWAREQEECGSQQCAEQERVWQKTSEILHVDPSSKPPGMGGAFCHYTI